MKVEMYSVYDLKTRVYSPPVCCHNDGHAKRVFTNVFSDPQHTAFKYPDDFNLFSIGSYDDSTGKIEVLTNPKLLCSAYELISEIVAKVD